MIYGSSSSSSLLSKSNISVSMGKGFGCMFCTFNGSVVGGYGGAESIMWREGCGSFVVGVVLLGCRVLVSGLLGRYSELHPVQVPWNNDCRRTRLSAA